MTHAIDSSALRAARFSEMSALQVSGADAKTFLQGQLSIDLQTLTPDRVLLAACNSAQGRVQAVLWIVERTDGLALVLPTSMVDSIVARLRKYVLRSKVMIDAKHQHAVALAPSEGAAERWHVERSGLSVVQLPGHSQLLLLGVDQSVAEDAGAAAQWRREHIAAGLPTVYPQTHEAFVAQMLNIDVLGGISFNKGCYTGQEIIARAHYRGAVKRRMLRFEASCPPPSPGARVLVGDQHAGDVVDAAATSTGCELLAVVSLAHADQPLTVEGAALHRLPLPYSISSSTE